MRDNLPANGPYRYESAIVNLDDANNDGTHWVAYRKRGKVVNYYDSFGNLPPPLELVQYFQRGGAVADKIFYNYERHQKFNSVWCGHLCLKFLSNIPVKSIV